MSFLMASSLDEALSAVEGGRIPLAGGTDVYPRMRSEGKEGDLVGLERLDELRLVEEREGFLFLGAALTWQQIIDSARVAKEAPLLVLAARHVGGPAIRHMGTVGGNVCTASPAGDGLLALVALEARVELLSRGKRRLLPLEDFLVGPGKTDLRWGELLRAVAIPGDGGRPFFRKVGRRKTLAISLGSLAALWHEEEGRLKDVRLVFGSMAPCPCRVTEAEAFLEGKSPDEALFRAAASICSEAVDPVDDIRAQASYRRLLAGGLVEEWGFQVLGERT